MIKIEKYIEVIHRIFSLLDTLEEGIEHIKRQLEELRYEEAFSLLQDAMMGVDSIESAIQPMMPKLPENNLEILETALKETMSKVASSYEDVRETNLEKQLEEGIPLTFKNWKQELDKVLKPYIIS